MWKYVFMYLFKSSLHVLGRMESLCLTFELLPVKGCPRVEGYKAS